VNTKKLWVRKIEEYSLHCLRLGKYLLRLSKDCQSDTFTLNITHTHQAMGVSRGTLHHQLKKLESLGFISFDGKRTQHVSPTITLNLSTEALNNIEKSYIGRSTQSSLKLIIVGDSSSLPLPIGHGGPCGK
jgi:hypothetical protein